MFPDFEKTRTLAYKLAEAGIETDLQINDHKMFISVAIANCMKFSDAFKSETKSKIEEIDKTAASAFSINLQASPFSDKFSINVNYLEKANDEVLDIITKSIQDFHDSGLHYDPKKIQETLSRTFKVEVQAPKYNGLREAFALKAKEFHVLTNIYFQEDAQAAATKINEALQAAGIDKITVAPQGATFAFMFDHKKSQEVLADLSEKSVDLRGILEEAESNAKPVTVSYRETNRPKRHDYVFFPR